MTKRIVRDRVFIDGRWEAAAFPTIGIDVIDSRNGRVMGAATAGGPKDVDRAVSAARSSLQDWSSTSSEHRAHPLESLADALEAQRDEAARIISLEVGTPTLISRRVQVGLPVAPCGLLPKRLETCTGRFSGSPAHPN